MHPSRSTPDPFPEDLLRPSTPATAFPEEHLDGKAGGKPGSPAGGEQKQGEGAAPNHAPSPVARGHVQEAVANGSTAMKSVATPGLPEVPGGSGIQETGDDDVPWVLAAHPDTEVLKLVRETLLGAGEVRVVTSPSPEYAFELAMQQRYCLFFFGLEFETVDGFVLYELVEKAYRFAKEPRPAPGVVFIGDTVDAGKMESLWKDARVKSVLTEPLRSEQILASCEDKLPGIAAGA